ncbi:hypothetical protein DFH06DRAFT_1249105 [Mycena polygramma]|nr:hypothetical protein DFH06DRAFT_1249105 [Mycena polygramma]
MTTRSRRDTGEINALGSARRGEDTPQQNGRDPEKIELHAQRGRSPARDTGLESNRLPSPRLRPRPASCPPIPQRSDTVVRFPRELATMAIGRGPVGATRELSREGSIEAAMPPRQERHLRKRPAPPPESTDTTLASTDPDVPSRCSPSPSLSSSTLTPPPPELPAAEVCSHCRSTVVPRDGWRPSVLEPGRKICDACYTYEWKHRKPRPLELEIKRSQRGVKECAHCGATTFARWEFSRVKPGRKLCHPCAQYERTHNKRSQRNGPKTSSSRLRRSRRSG